MVGLNREFILGKFKKAVLIKGKSASDNLKSIIKEAFRKNLIDSVIATTFKKDDERVITEPVFIDNIEDIENLNISFFTHGGQNSILKNVIQKYSFEKLGIIGHSCVMDGINKCQYFGIGANFTSLKFAMKIGVGCLGALSVEGIKCLLKEIGKPYPDTIEEISIKNGKIALTIDKEELTFSINDHYFYINEGCKVCMNLSARGSDVTFIPTFKDGYSICLLRSEKGEILFENSHLTVKPAKENEILEIENLIKIVLKYNIETILERAELGIPSNKWDGNRYGRFSALWNNIYADNIEEEVF